MKLICRAVSFIQSFVSYLEMHISNGHIFIVGSLLVLFRGDQSCSWRATFLQRSASTYLTRSLMILQMLFKRGWPIVDFTHNNNLDCSGRSLINQPHLEFSKWIPNKNKHNTPSKIVLHFITENKKSNEPWKCTVRFTYEYIWIYYYTLFIHVSS